MNVKYKDEHKLYRLRQKIYIWEQKYKDEYRIYRLRQNI